MNKDKTKVPTFDTIVEEQRDLLEKIKVVPIMEPPHYDSRTIFHENNPHFGFLSKPQIQESFKKFQVKELALMKFLFEAITNSEPIITSRFPERGLDGKDYFWIRTNGIHGHLYYKVPSFLHLDIILEEYLHCPFNLNFEDFYKEVFN